MHLCCQLLLLSVYFAAVLTCNDVMGLKNQAGSYEGATREVERKLVTASLVSDDSYYITMKHIQSLWQ